MVGLLVGWSIFCREVYTTHHYRMPDNYYDISQPAKKRWFPMLLAMKKRTFLDSGDEPFLHPRHWFIIPNAAEFFPMVMRLVMASGCFQWDPSPRRRRWSGPRQRRASRASAPLQEASQSSNAVCARAVRCVAPFHQVALVPHVTPSGGWWLGGDV